MPAPERTAPLPDGENTRSDAPETPAAPPGHRDGSAPLELARVHQVWEELVKKVGVNLGVRLSQAAPIGVEEPDILVIGPRSGYNRMVDSCGTDEALKKIGHCLQRLLRRPVTVRYERSSEPSPPGHPGSSGEPRRPELLAADPMIQKVVELFEARPLHLEYDDDSDSN
jgi:hypothetical protein